LLHIINDNRIWPSFFYSSSDSVDEQILIGSFEKDSSVDDRYKSDVIGLGIDTTVTVITYKTKNVLQVLTEIAGLLVLTTILTLLLTSFNEWMFDRKIKRQTNDEFRDIFTYSNFKRTMIENQEMKAQNQ
jgi:hypothetical protein